MSALPPHEQFYQDHSLTTRAAAGGYVAASTPVSASLSATNPLITYVLTRGDQFIRPSEFASMRGSFEAALYRALGGQAVLNDEVLSRAYGVSATAYACAERRAFFTAGVPLYVGDPQGAPIEGTPLDYFVAQNAAVTLYHSTISALVWGRVYLRKQYNEHQYPTGLEFLNPASIYESINRTTGFVDWYEYRDPITFKVDRILPQQMLVLNTFDSRPGGAGLSKFEVAWKELSVQLGMATYAAAFFVNSAAPDGVISFEAEVEEQWLDLAEEQWRKSFKGAKNAHRTAFLPAGGKWTPIQAALKDLAMGDLDDRTSKRIHAIFDIDPALTSQEAVSDPLSANSTYSTIEVSHVRNVVLPFLKLFILPVLNQEWAHRDFDRSGYYTIYYDESAIPALAEANLVKAQTAQQMRDTHVLDDDESRELIGFEPRDPKHYFIRSPKEAVQAWQAGAIDWNTLQFYTRGEVMPTQNGAVVLIGGSLIPLSRMLDVAHANADRMKGPPVMFLPQNQTPPQTPPDGTNNGSGGNDIQVTKPPTPALPAPGALSQPEERALGESLCVALGFSNQPDLLSLQQRLRQQFVDQTVMWRPGDDLHCTLLYAPSVTDEQAQRIIQNIRALDVQDDLALRIGSLNSFDRLGEYSLHFRIGKNAALLELQDAVYEFASWAGVGISSYSAPAVYKPHITMGTLQTRPNPIVFDPKLSLTPSAIWVYRGDNIVYERSLTTPAIAPALAPVLPLPQSPASTVTPLPPAQQRSYIGAPTTGTPGATMLLPIANPGALVALQDTIREMLIEGNGERGEPSGIRWTPPEAFHVTLISAPLIDDNQLRIVMEKVPGGTLPALRLLTDPLSTFEQNAYTVLILPIAENATLTEIQQMFYTSFAEHGIPMSPFSEPDAYQPHITLAYIPKNVVLPTAEQLAARVPPDPFEFVPNALIVSRDSFETVASFPVSVPLDPATGSTSTTSPSGAQNNDSARRATPMPTPDPLEVVVGFAEAQVLRYARRDLDTFLRERDYANPQWVSESDWRLPLAALEVWDPRDAAALLRQADFSEMRKLDLWSNGYVQDSGGTIYLRIDDGEGLDALQTSVSLELQAIGRTPLIPAQTGIPLCVGAEPIDLTGAPSAHYPLVAANVTLLKGMSPQQVWALRRSPRESRSELERWDKATRNKGAEYPFVTVYLSRTPTERFVRSALRAGVEQGEVFDLAYALLDGDWTLRSYAETEDGFVSALTDLFAEGQTNDITRRKFAAQLRMYLNDYGLVAFRDGMTSVGYNPESLSQDDVAVFRAWQSRQSAFVTGLGAELYGPGITADQVAQRVRMWADISLGEIRFRGIAQGNGEKLYRWDYYPSAKHCVDCPQLDGQIHTMREWLDEDLWPGSGKTECGPGCKCQFTATQDTARGNFLRSLTPDHEHSHTHAETNDHPDHADQRVNAPELEVPKSLEASVESDEIGQSQEQKQEYLETEAAS